MKAEDEANILRAQIALLEARMRELEQLSMEDELTGLMNRRALDMRLAQETMRAVRHGRCFSILFIDLDEFKEANDSGGHAAGDNMLRAMADLLKMRCRITDIVGRWGGDEFVVILPDTDLGGARALAERLLAGNLDRRKAPIRFSLGVAALSAGEGAEELLKAADAELYRAKNEGGGRYCCRETD